MSDGELVLAALNGQGSAYEELVHRWTARVLAVCHAKVRRADVAEDLAQETLMRGFVALKALSDPEKFGAWLHGIAIRTCLDWLKARARKQVPFSSLGGETGPDGLFPAPGDGAAAALEKDDERREILSEVERLPEDLRKVIMLFYYEDSSYREMAHVLGVSPATINARLTKARDLLRRRMSAARR